ncbi:MAG TPA: efflux RND transporter periplasmic adaptor subunit [Kiloniellales bacterium]
MFQTTGRALSASARAAIAPTGILLAVSVLLLAACDEQQPEVMENVRAIKTITVSERGSGQLRRFPGIVAAVDTSSISFEVAGNTREVNVKVGDRVEEGQVLATLDDKPFQLNVEGAEAEVGRAKAQLAEKETDYVRQKTLYEKDWVAKAAYDQALAARDSAANQVSYAVSKLNLARRDFEKTVLAAPFDGVIANKFVDPFQEVARGEKVFEIYREGAMEVVVSVPETAIGEVYLGLPAEITFPSEQVASLKGRVSEIGTVAGDANAFPVKVALAEPPDRVLPGMTAEVALILGEAGGGTSYLVPVSAIAAGDAPGQGFVFVFDPQSSTVKKTAISGRGVQDNRVFITEGIAPGDVIAVAGVSFLRDGQKVKLMAP